MRINGKNMCLYAVVDGEYKRIALSTSCEVNVQGEYTDVSSLLSGRGKTSRPGRYSWSLTSSSVIDDTDSMSLTLLEHLVSGKPMMVFMNIDANISASGRSIGGQVYVQSWKEGAPIGSMATYSVTFLGNGDIELP